MLHNVALGSTVVGVILMVVGAVSRLSMAPIMGLESRVFAGGAALLFLLAISLHSCVAACEKK